MKERYVEPRGFGCWALVQLPKHNRARVSVPLDQRCYRLGPGQVESVNLNCTKDHRPGHLTCWHHREWEDAAQEYKKRFVDPADSRFPPK